MPVKYFSNQRFVQSNGFEDLGAAIALQRRDSHLREDFQQTLVDRFLVLLERLLKRGARRQHAFAREIFEGFDCEIRIHRAGAVSNQETEVLDFSRLTRFDDERDLGTRAFAHEVVVNRRQSEQARDRSRLCIDVAIGQNQHRVSGLDRERSALTETVESALEFEAAAGYLIKRRQSSREQIAGGDTTQLLKVPIGKDRMIQLERVAMLRSLIENIEFVPDIAGQRHHQFFANGIDGRVRHLREKLLEIVKEYLRFVR